jgi:hypothetical protein
MRPSGHFLRVFLSPSFTHGCHWLAVLPGKDCTACQFGPKWLVGDENPFREGILFRVAGRKASVVGNCCLRSTELVMLPGRLVLRTRCHGAASLGGTFTFLTGISHCRSSQSPPATSSATAAMPLKITRGKKASPSFCCTAWLLVELVDGVEMGVGLGSPPGFPLVDGVVALAGGATRAGTVALVVGVAMNVGEGEGVAVAVGEGTVVGVGERLGGGVFVGLPANELADS